MADGSSVIGAAPTQAIQTDFGVIAEKGMARVDMLRREDEAKKEALRREKEAKLSKIQDDYGFDEDLMVLKGSEFRTLDDATTQTLHQLRDRYYTVYKDLESNPNDLEGKKRLGRIQSTIKNIKASYDKMSLIGEEYKKKVSEGQLSGIHEKNYKEILEATDEGRLNITLDKNDNLQFVFYEKPNEEGDSEVERVMSYKDLIQGSLYDKVDITAEIDGIVKGFGENITTDAKGGFLVTTSELAKEQKQIASDMIQGQIEDDAVVADILNQMNGSMKETGFTPEERKAVHTEMMKRVEARFGKKVSKQQLRDESRGSDNNIGFKENIKLSLDPSTGKPLRVQGKGVGFSLRQGIQLDAADKNAKVDEIFLNANGQLAYQGQQKRKIEAANLTTEEKEIVDKKSMEYLLSQLDPQDPRIQTESVFVPLTGNNIGTANKIASRLGFNNAVELRQYLESITPQGTFSGNKNTNQSTGTVR